jgi:hypothetical protein
MNSKPAAYALGMFLLLLSSFYMSSCRDQSFTTDPEDVLAFSTDTLQFDTVFTTIGSATRSFRVFNNANQSIRISSIELAGGMASMFRMNVDGLPGAVQEDVEIAPNDSLWIFVEVTVDPTNELNPFVQEDSVIFLTNGVRQSVLLAAWGQNAHFFNGDRICDEVWTDDKPYVIYNSIQVDSMCTLTIQEGCRIHLHAGSGIFVDGTLIVNGETDSVVTFEGDRLEPFFRDKPGQWSGIYLLRGSTGNRIENAVIKNANDGVLLGFSRVGGTDFNPGNKTELELSNVQIHDHSGSGIFAILSDIEAENTLIYNIGGNNLAVAAGGNYNFTHCTLANYGSLFLNHQNSVLLLSNLINLGQDSISGADIILTADLEEANFTNTIIEGNILEFKEIALADIEDGTAFEHLFDHCFLRTDLDPSEFNNVDCFFNTDPLFEDRSDRDYSLDTLSTAIDAGTPTFVNTDLFGNMRPFPGTDPDIGAIEFGYEPE